MPRSGFSQAAASEVRICTPDGHAYTGSFKPLATATPGTAAASTMTSRFDAPRPSIAARDSLKISAVVGSTRSPLSGPLSETPVVSAARGVWRYGLCQVPSKAVKTMRPTNANASACTIGRPYAPCAVDVMPNAAAIQQPARNRAFHQIGFVVPSALRNGATNSAPTTRYGNSADR